MNEPIETNLIEHLLKITQEMHSYAKNSAWMKLCAADQKRQIVLHEISQKNIGIGVQQYGDMENILHLDTEITQCVKNRSHHASISALQIQYAKSEYTKFSN